MWRYSADSVRAWSDPEQRGGKCKQSRTTLKNPDDGPRGPELKQNCARCYQAKPEAKEEGLRSGESFQLETNEPDEDAEAHEGN